MARRLHLFYTAGLTLAGVALAFGHAPLAFALTKNFIFKAFLRFADSGRTEKKHRSNWLLKEAQVAKGTTQQRLDIAQHLILAELFALRTYRAERLELRDQFGRDESAHCSPIQFHPIRSLRRHSTFELPSNIDPPITSLPQLL